MQFLSNLHSFQHFQILSEAFLTPSESQYTVKPVLSSHSKRNPKIGFQDQFLLNAGQKYCRMLQWEHSAILSTFIKLPFVIKIFVLSIFEWPLKTGFTVSHFETVIKISCFLRNQLIRIHTVRVKKSTESGSTVLYSHMMYPYQY